MNWLLRKLGISPNTFSNSPILNTLQGGTQVGVTTVTPTLKSIDYYGGGIQMLQSPLMQSQGSPATVPPLTVMPTVVSQSRVSGVKYALRMAPPFFITVNPLAVNAESPMTVPTMQVALPAQPLRNLPFVKGS